MATRSVWRPPGWTWPLLGVVGLLATWKLLPEKLEGHWEILTPLLIVVGIIVVRKLWYTHPAVTMCAAVALSVFSGAWAQMGLGNLPINRLLAVLVLLQILLRAPGTASLPRITVRNIHVLMALTLLYALGSAVASDTLTTEKGFLTLWDTLGVMPFLLFLVAPAVFARPRERDMLLITLLILGAYLGATAVFEILGPRALVFPRYIVASDAATPGVLRAGGPFQAAIANGAGTFVCAVAAATAVREWKGERRAWLAAGVGLLALVGCFLTLERGVWVAALIATIGMALFSREGRRLIIPGLVAGAVCLFVILSLSSSLSNSASERASDQRSVSDRQSQIGAGLRMLQAKPLLGFGWSRFQAESGDYYREPETYPLSGYLSGTIIGQPQIPQPLHNSYLSFAVELGLIGVLLWLITLLWAAGEGIFRRAPVSMRPWKQGLVGVALFVLILIAVNPHEPPFPFLILFVWAGVALGESPLPVTTGLAVTSPLARRQTPGLAGQSS